MSIFSDEENSRFWGSVNPDVRSILREFESRESWTYIISEHPELYSEIASIVESTTDNKAEELMRGESTRCEFLDNLIFTLSSISFSYCILGLAVLDKKKLSDGNTLAESIAERVSLAYYNDLETSYFAESRILYERISLFVDSSLMVKLFSNLK